MMFSHDEILNLRNHLHSFEERIMDLETIISRRLVQNSPVNSGDTCLLIISTAIMFMMSVPAVGLYYAGMVKVPNVLATVHQSFTIACIITALWFIMGYSLSLGPPAQGDLPVQWNQHSSLYYGDASRFWYDGMGEDSIHQLAPTIPESVFATYQLVFAVIAACLISGCMADRIKYQSLVIFISLWHIAVYCPICHASWHPDGFLYKAGVMDFAGGNVVHISSGCAGIVVTAMLGRRKTKPVGGDVEDALGNNALLTFIGASLIWIG
jgi:Amt family ammonium transporter